MRVENREQLVTVDAVACEELRGRALALPEQGEQQVLGPDTRVPEGERFPQRQLQDLLGSRCERNASRRPRSSPADGRDDLLLDQLAAQSQLGQDLRCGAARRRSEDAEQQVLGVHVVAAEPASRILRLDDGPSSIRSEPGDPREAAATGLYEPSHDAPMALLGGLTRDAQCRPDLRPRAALAARGLDEMIDDLVADRGELRAEHARARDAGERRVVQRLLLDSGDQMPQLHLSICS